MSKTAKPLPSMDPARSAARRNERANRPHVEAQARLRAITPGVATPATIKVAPLWGWKGPTR